MNESIESRLGTMMNNAVELVSNKNYQDADIICSEVLRYCPGFPDALHIKGIASYELGRNTAAINFLQSAIKNAPGIAAYYISLARVYLGVSRHIDAVNACTNALEIKPGSSEIYELLSSIYRKMGEMDRAVDFMEKAMQADPLNNVLEFRHAAYMAESGHLEEALELSNQLEEKYPDNPGMHYYAGYIHELNHENETAISHYKKSLDIKPDNTGPYLKLSGLLSEYRDNESLIEKIETLMKEKNLSNYEQISMHFVLGKLYGETGNYEKAFENYETGNEAIHLAGDYDRQEHTLYIDRIIQTFSPNLFQQFGDAGIGTNLPVFIVGMPRSGTSLVEQIIASHPDVYGAGELPYISMMTSHMHEGMQTSRKYPRCVKWLTVDKVNSYAEDYIACLEKKSVSALRITDKSPTNFLHIGLIFMMFPNAKIIHCQRNPMDVCFSNYIQLFSSPLSYSYDLQDLGQYYLDYKRLMEHWNSLFGDSILNVNYEDLVSDTEKVAKEIIAYCELSWNDQCLSPHKNKRYVNTASYAQVRNPVYTKSVNRWKSYEKYLLPLREILAD